MALTLKDLLQAQSDLKQKDEAAKPASMSMDQLKQMSGAAAPSGNAPKSTGDATLIKIYQELKKQSSILVEIAKNNAKASTTVSREDTIEGKRSIDRQTALLEKIAENTGIKVTKEPEEKDKEGSGMLGAIGTALAIALGSIVGSLIGYAKAIIDMNKFLFKGIEKALVWVGQFFPSIKKVLFNIEVTFSLGAQMIKEAFSNFAAKAVRIFDGAVDFIKGIFSGDGFSKIAKIFNTVKSTISSFFAPITEAFKVIESASGPVAKAVSFVKNAISGVFQFFSGLGNQLSMFGKIFGATMKIFAKLAYPLTIIMTVWDTVKGAIEGFEKGGIIGGIAGAIKGLMNSLVMAPLDMLKSAVSWILGAFGFDEAEKMLDSFSFVDMYSAFIDAVFSPIETLKKIFTGAAKMLESIGIPEISFTIPIIDKKISFGPYYPFKKDQPAAAASVEGGSDAGKKEVPAGKSGATPAGTETGQAGLAQSMKDNPMLAMRAGVPNPRGTGAAAPKTVDEIAMAEAKKYGRTKPNVDDMTVAQDQFEAQKDKRKATVGTAPAPGKPGVAPAEEPPVTFRRSNVTQEKVGGRQIAGYEGGYQLVGKKEDVQKADAAWAAFQKADFAGDDVGAEAAAKEFTQLATMIKSPEYKAKMKEISDRQKGKKPGGPQPGAAAQAAAVPPPPTPAVTPPSAAAAPSPKPKATETAMGKPKAASEDGKYANLPVTEKAMLAKKMLDEGQPGFEATPEGKIRITNPDFLPKGALVTTIGAKRTTVTAGGEAEPTTGGAAAQPTAQPATAAGAVYEKSGEAAQAAVAPAAQPSGGTVVSAPTTTVNNTTNAVTRVPSRNTDTSLTNFYNKRYAY